MNILDAMDKVKDLNADDDLKKEGIENLIQVNGTNDFGENFYNIGNGPRPLYTGYTGNGASIPDMDFDGIPDHMDYHFGPGQW